MSQPMRPQPNPVPARQPIAPVVQPRALAEESAFGGAGPNAFGGAAVDDDEETQKEIARIMQEEAYAMDAQNMDRPESMQQQFNQPQPGLDRQESESGVRRPDEMRVQSLMGPDADYDAEADRRWLLQQQQRDQQRQGGGGFMNDMG